MNENRDSSTVQSPRVLRRVVGMVVLASVVAAGLAWGLRTRAIVPADEEGRWMARLYLGGGGMAMHWGLVIGHKDMPIPPSDTSDFGEERFPLAPGAYIWLTE